MNYQCLGFCTTDSFWEKTCWQTILLDRLNDCETNTGKTLFVLQVILLQFHVNFLALALSD